MIIKIVFALLKCPPYKIFILWGLTRKLLSWGKTLSTLQRLSALWCGCLVRDSNSHSKTQIDNIGKYNHLQIFFLFERHKLSWGIF